MKLHLSRAEGRNQITSCRTDGIVVNGVCHAASLLVTPLALIADWPVTSAQRLTSAHLSAVLELKPEVVLLGTGAQLHFPEAEVMRPLIDAGIGFEVMDTGAACRTYNILMAEGRQVLAALIVR
jgi:uncharacterized protein